jgi:hypothetical protein
MYIYIYIIIYMYIHTYIHTCLLTCLFTYLRTYVRTYIHISRYFNSSLLSWSWTKLSSHSWGAFWPFWYLKWNLVAHKYMFTHPTAVVNPAWIQSFYFTTNLHIVNHTYESPCLLVMRTFLLVKLSMLACWIQIVLMMFLVPPRICDPSLNQAFCYGYGEPVDAYSAYLKELDLLQKQCEATVTGKQCIGIQTW